MPVQFRNRDVIRQQHPAVADALDDIAKFVDNIMVQTNTSQSGQTPPPPNVTGLSVSAAHGIFDVGINDNNSDIARGINYFLEYSPSPHFESPTVIDLGQSRNWRGHLGNQQLYWRAYSSYPTSARSLPANFIDGQGRLVAMAGGGTDSGPSIQPSNGSGTTRGADTADGGFGSNQYRRTKV